MLMILFVYLKKEVILISSLIIVIAFILKFSLQLKLKTVLLFHSLISWWKKLIIVSALVYLGKNPFTGLYTNFFSLSPNWYKTNLISCLVYPAFHICSSYAKFHNEILRIKCILATNCFPQSLVDKFIRSFLYKQFSKVSTSNKQEGKKDIYHLLSSVFRYI